MTLYELTDEYRQLLALAEDPDTDPEFLKDTFEALSGEIEAKADGYAKADKELEAKAEIIKTEADRLKNWLSAIERNRKLLKAALQEAMIATGKRKIETDLFRFSIQKNPPSVVMDEYYIGNIPEEYLKSRKGVKRHRASGAGGIITDQMKCRRCGDRIISEYYEIEGRIYCPDCIEEARALLEVNDDKGRIKDRERRVEDRSDNQKREDN